jgi:fatty-acyl-CoA synthase
MRSPLPTPVAGAAGLRAIEATGLAAFQPHASIAAALEATAARHAGRAAIRFLPSARTEDPPRAWTHAELLAEVRRAANLFRTLGAGAKRPVAFLLPAIPAAWWALLGAECAGCVCPINYLLEAGHIAALLNAADAAVLVALAPQPGLDLAPKVAALRAACPRLGHVLWAHGPVPAGAPAGDLGFEAALAAQGGERFGFEPPDSPHARCALFHTGGTTGAPKLAMHTHANQLHTATAAAHFYAMDERDVVINGFPLFHVAGAFVYGLSTMLAGGCLVLPTLLAMRDPAFVRRYWAFAARERATILAAVPTVMSTLLALDPEGADLSSVRVLYTGGSPLPDELAAAFERRHGIPVRNILGMTECAGLISIEPFLAPRTPGSCGWPLPFTKVVAFDAGAEAVPGRADGAIAPLPAGRTGVLAVRGPHVGPGYTDPARNAGTFTADGWLVTGDLGHLDAEGRVFVTGRAKDLIIRSGHNIDPQAVEDALLAHPEVLHAAVVGEPDAYAGELPVAFVVRRAGAASDGAAILDAVRPRIAERPAWPRRVTLLEDLPVTAIGKVFKPELRRLAAEAAIGERLLAAGLAPRVRVEARLDANGVRLRFAPGTGPGAIAAADADAIAALMQPHALRWELGDTDAPRLA